MQQWRKVPKWEQFYEVSNFGEVRSIDRTVFHVRFKKFITYKGRILKPGITKKNYKLVVFTRPKERRCFYVHDLVCLAFQGIKPPKLEVRHLDGDSLNNNLKNLKYGTTKENALDKIRHGRNNGLKGAQTANAKLTMLQVRLIRKNPKAKSVAAWAEQFDISTRGIYNVLNFKSYIE